MRVLHIAALWPVLLFGTVAAAQAPVQIPVQAPAGAEGFAWAKFCGQERDRDAADGGLVCFTGSAGPKSVTAALVEPQGDAGKPVFRVALPGPLQVQYGVHLIVDRDPPLTGSFFTCWSSRCVADYEATPGLLTRLKAGRTLRLEAIGLLGAAVGFELPLGDPAGGGFRAAAEEAAAIDDAVFDERQRQLLAYPRTLPGAPVRGQPSVYSPWEKFCGKGRDGRQNSGPTRQPAAGDGGEVCFTGRDARAGDGRVLFAAALIEPAGGRDKVFRVNLPSPLRLDYGVRLIIDRGEPLSGTFFTCYTDACMADYEATPELVARLAAGGTLAVAAIDLEGRAVSFALPLSDTPGSGFSSAHDGPAIDPGAFAQQQKKLQEDLQKRAEEMRRKLEAEGQK